MLKQASFRAVSLLLCLSLVLAGCSSGSDGSRYTGQQKQQMETANIEGSYNNVFNATRTVFLNEGLILKEVDQKSGFIRCTLDVARSRVTGGRVIGTIFVVLFAVVTLGLALILLPFMYGHRGYDQIDITASLVDIGSNTVEVRLQTPMLEKQSEKYGMALKRIFAEIKKQTLILEAAGRT
jgi:hypothetical protein